MNNYTIQVKSNSPKLLDRMYHQAFNSLCSNERAKITGVEKFTYMDEDDPDSFEIVIGEGYKFKPIIMYGTDPNLLQTLSDDIVTEITITGNINRIEMFKKIGESIHQQFSGLDAYSNNDICISIDFKRNVYVVFRKCGYFPIIEMIEDN